MHSPVTPPVYLRRAPVAIGRKTEARGASQHASSHRHRRRRRQCKPLGCQSAGATWAALSIRFNARRAHHAPPTGTASARQPSQVQHGALHGHFHNAPGERARCCVDLARDGKDEKGGADFAFGALDDFALRERGGGGGSEVARPRSAARPVIRAARPLSLARARAPFCCARSECTGPGW